MEDQCMIKQHLFVNQSIMKNNKEYCLQIHKHRCYTLTSIFCIEVIKEIIKMRFVFLSHFIMKNLKSFSMLCIFNV